MLFGDCFTIERCCETSHANVGLFLRLGGVNLLCFLFLLRFLILLCYFKSLRCLMGLSGVNYSELHFRSEHIQLFRLYMAGEGKQWDLALVLMKLL